MMHSDRAWDCFAWGLNALGTVLEMQMNCVSENFPTLPQRHVKPLACDLGY